MSTPASASSRTLKGSTAGALLTGEGSRDHKLLLGDPLSLLIARSLSALPSLCALISAEQLHTRAAANRYSFCRALRALPRRSVLAGARRGRAAVDETRHSHLDALAVHEQRVSVQERLRGPGQRHGRAVARLSGAAHPDGRGVGGVRAVAQRFPRNARGTRARVAIAGERLSRQNHVRHGRRQGVAEGILEPHLSRGRITSSVETCVSRARVPRTRGRAQAVVGSRVPRAVSGISVEGELPRAFS